VLIAIPTGLLTAYAYERGEQTLWANALVHAGTNAPVMLTSVAVATAIMVAAFRSERRAAGRRQAT
jgi:membrane protease YdiL (CAAX protease family)